MRPARARTSLRSRAAGLALAVAVFVGLLVRPFPGAGLAQTTSPTPEAPPPTPVVLPGGATSPSPFPQVLHTASPPAHVPEVRAAAALLVDLDTGQTLFALEPAVKRPIASLTKIMTALVVLEEARPSDVVTVSEHAASGRVAGISSLGLVPGEQITVGELLYALLLQSANDAAVALAEYVSGTVEAFVEQMNARGRELGLRRTRFASPNGLDDAGYSTARDLVRLTLAAFAEDLFARIVATRFHEIASPDDEPRVIQNRNALLWLYPGAIGAKTGFTSAAGFCVVAAAERDGLRLAAIILGEPGEPFSDAATLLNYGFAAFERRTLIAEGRSLGTVPIGGREIPVAAGGALVGLVPVGAHVRREISVHPRTAFPPPRGAEIGTVTLSIPGRTVGEVPLVVVDVPPPEPLADDDPWWGRAFGAVVDAGSGLLDALFG